MSLLSNINNVSFTSRYDVDKVIYKTSGSRSVAQATTMADSILITIPHGLGYAPLCLGQFSESSDFSTAYEFGNPPYWYDALFGLYAPRIDAVVESDSTNVYVRIINFDTTRTIYYRLIGIIPPEVTSSPKMDTSDRNSDIFNAQDNFLKIFSDTKTEVSVNGISATTLTIPHDLGYRPMAIVYTEESGRIYRSGSENQFGVSGVFSFSYVDSANIYVEVDSFSPGTITVYTRIYLDN